MEIELRACRNVHRDTWCNVDAVIYDHRPATLQHGVLIHHSNTSPVQCILPACHEGNILHLTALQMETEAVCMGCDGIGVRIWQGYFDQHEEAVIPSHLEISAMTALQVLPIHINTEWGAAGMLQTHLYYPDTTLVVVIHQKAFSAAAHGADNGIKPHRIAAEGKSCLRICCPRIIVIATANRTKYCTYYIYV